MCCSIKKELFLVKLHAMNRRKKLECLFAWREFYLQNELFENARNVQYEIDELDS